MADNKNSVVAYIGLGSNLGDSVATLSAAASALAAMPETELLNSASLYKSAPVGTDKQPDYINSVCGLKTTLAPEELLLRLLDIERSFGRQRSGAPW